ncbi:hypothetical protein [Oryza sativa Japonica Group]|uniref:Uncharacterized protein P0410E03.27 n=1 Tax=Oryza sativa subsp. japonica TaxID=39947 RepID=Q5ZE09_ORYSJ|nr:hypothetical protein [Oryza sativa Japonica Group]
MYSCSCADVLLRRQLATRDDGVGGGGHGGGVRGGGCGFLPPSELTMAQDAGAAAAQDVGPRQRQRSQLSWASSGERCRGCDGQRATDETVKPLIANQYV